MSANLFLEIWVSLHHHSDVIDLEWTKVKVPCRRLGIRGTQVKSSIQDIVDEVAPIKKLPYGVEGRFIRM
jgi:hypothetical protein